MIEFSNDIIALIAEGGTERAILQLLLDHQALKFTQDDLLDGEIIRTRSGEKFTKNHLNKSFRKKVHVVRILDSPKEKFKYSKVYDKTISKVDEVLTRPEIEILHIIYHQDYSSYSNKHKQTKPSIYVKQNYHDLTNPKGYQDNYDFWELHFNELIESLKQYRQTRTGNELCIADLLNDDYQ